MKRYGFNNDDATKNACATKGTMEVDSDDEKQTTI